MPLQCVDNSDQKIPPGGPYSIFGRLGYRVHNDPIGHGSPFLSVHRARTIRGGLGQGLYWDPEAVAHFPSTAGKKVKTTE